MKRSKSLGKFRSKLEKTFSTQLTESGFDYVYEPDRFDYMKAHTYCPDFKIAENLYIETKGLFSGSDRTKMILCREQNPGLEVILAFQNPDLTLSKVSKTTYGAWATKNNFKWFRASDITELKAILTVLKIQKKKSQSTSPKT